MKYKNKEFDKFNINLGKNVFIPRDNIFMYQKIIKRLGTDERNFNLLELGTGTGAISISLAKSFKNAEIVATDISNLALKIAKENAKINKVDNRIDFKTTLIPYRVNTDWIEKKLIEMKDVLNLEEPPKIEKTCEKCAYLEGGKKF